MQTPKSMKTEQTQLLFKQTPPSDHSDDCTLKRLSTSITYIDSMESITEAVNNIELTMRHRRDSLTDLVLARMETNASIHSSGSSKSGGLKFTPLVSEEAMKASVEEISAGWKKLILVAKSIHRFRSLRVERINSHSGLKSSIDSAPRSKTTFPAFGNHQMFVTIEEIEAKALGMFRNQLSFFKALEVGSEEDLLFIRDMLGNDPKANLYDAANPERLANKPDHRGYTPLYVACKNGNLELVKLLIQFQANPYQTCQVTKKENESIISVAARWSHLELIKYFLSEDFIWDEAELRKVYNETEGDEIKRIICTQMVPRKKSCWSQIFPCLPVY